MGYEPTNTPFKTRPRMQNRWTPERQQILNLVGQNFTLSTLLLIGAAVQSTIILILPLRYAILPAFFVLTFRSIDTALITYNFKPNPYLKDAYLARRAALIPDSDGQNLEASAQKVAILLLGAKSNHPLGIFAPQFRKTGEYLQRMMALFDSPDSPKGLMGQTAYDRKDERGAREMLYISYWRSIEDLHAFAHGPLHREAWQWWERDLKENGYVGICHEIFEAEPGAWENVYVNFQPTLLGATTFLRKGAKTETGVVQDEWIMPLVDASRGKLAKSSGRLGRAPTAFDATREGKEAYGTDEP